MASEYSKCTRSLRREKDGKETAAGFAAQPASEPISKIDNSKRAINQ